jgi:hypothetical protein
MKATALALVVAVSSTAHATDPPPPPLPPLSPFKIPEASLSPLRLDPGDLLRVEKRARYKRNVGIGLAVPGIALLVAGAVLIGAGIKDDHLATGGAEIAAGAISAGVGVIFTIPGALLWIGGQDDLDSSAWRRRRLTP